MTRFSHYRTLAGNATIRGEKKPGVFAVLQESKIIRMEIIETEKKEEEEANVFFKSKIGPKFYLSKCTI